MLSSRQALPNYLASLVQGVFKTQLRIQFPTFGLLLWTFISCIFSSFVSSPPVSRAVNRRSPRRDGSSVFALQRCRSCRWQLTSPGSRWRRSSVWTSTGASASPGAPLEPRRARRRTSESPVSKQVNWMWPTTSLHCFLSCLLIVHKDIDKMIICSRGGCTGPPFHFTINPRAIIICCLAESCCNYSLWKSSSSREENTLL